MRRHPAPRVDHRRRHPGRADELQGGVRLDGVHRDRVGAHLPREPLTQRAGEVGQRVPAGRGDRPGGHRGGLVGRGRGHPADLFERRLGVGRAGAVEHRRRRLRLGHPGPAGQLAQPLSRLSR
jgi:hypothetical protein